MTGATARWLPLPPESGLRTLKFWLHDSLPPERKVKWELRRLLDELRDAAADTNKILREERAQWNVVFQTAGCSDTDMLLPSAYAYRYKHREEPPLELVDEHQVETAGAICIMLWYRLLRRQPAGHPRADVVLRTFLETALETDDLVSDLELLTPSDTVLQASAQCQQQQGEAVSGDVCTHVRQIFVTALQMTEVGDVVSSLLQGMFSQRRTCCAASPSFKALIGKITLRVASHASALGTSNPLEGDTDVRGKNKRRLDGDRKSALIGRALTDRKAKSIHTLAVARDEVGGDNADRWLIQDVSAYRWATAASFQGVQNLALCYDASKVGQPKEETLVIAAAHVDRGLAAWFMPQAGQDTRRRPFEQIHVRILFPVLKSNLLDVPSGSTNRLEERLASCVEGSINRALLVEQLEEAKSRKKEQNADDIDFELMANKYFALSLDKSLQKSIQIGLSYFMPSNPQLLLKPGETLAILDLDAAECPKGSTPRRAVAKTCGSGEASHRVLVPREVRNGELHRPVLHRAQDEGSIGWVCSLWLDNCVQLRGSTIEDPSHRFHGNDFKNAFVASGVWLNVCEWGVLYNATTAPYEGHGNFSLLQECKEQYFKLRDHTCPLFALLYEPICDELRLPLLERGTEDHMRRVFHQIQGCAIFHRKGDRVKMGRWASWFRAAKFWRGQKMPALLVLLFAGIQRKWWDSLSGLPLLNVRSEELQDHPEAGDATAAPSKKQAVEKQSMSADVKPGSKAVSSEAASSSSSSRQVPDSGPPAPDAAVPPVAGLEKKSVKQSNVELKKLRSEAKHGLHFCANVLANTFGCCLTEQTVSICEPLCEFVDRMRTVCTSVRGSEQWHIDLVNGSLDTAIQRTWRLLTESEMLEQAGYCSRESHEWRTAAELEQDNRLAAALFDTFSNVATQFTLSGMTWTHRYPGRFVSLLDPNPKQQKANMLHVKKDFELFLKLQELAQHSPLAKSFMADLQWPLQTFVVEVFYMLFEIGFSELTDELRQLLVGFSRSWLASIIDEEAFNCLRNNSSNQAAGFMSRPARWGNLCRSPLLSQHGRRTVEVTATARAQGKGTIPKTAFVATNAGEFDLGSDALETMSSPNWPHPSPAGHKLVGAAWAAWQAAKGDLQVLSRSWQSLLATPGCMLADRGGQLLGVVLGCNPWCLFYMPTKSRRLPNGHLIIRPDPNGVLQTLCIQDANKWSAMKASIASPVQVAKWADAGDTCPGIAWKAEPGGTLFRRAARDGFCMMTKVFLDKLVCLLGLTFPKGKKPKTVNDIVKALVKHIIPGCTEEVISDALARRGSKGDNTDLAEHCILNVGENAAALEHCMDDDDHEILTKAVASVRKKQAHSESDAAAAGRPRQWVRKAVDKHKEYTLEDARSFLPKIDGCTLQLDETRFTRWCGLYPRLTPPRYCTKSWGPRTGLSNKQALFHVLQQLWTWHEEEQRGSCPWDFSELL
ncbi:dpf-6 [Symbiodinium sp. CCMP2592]|nr:dpf-6 [Symbiodinium sp. CCMP2592]